MTKHVHSRLAVDEFTTPSPISVLPATPVATVAEIMRKNGVSHVPVVEGGQAVGILSDRDMRMYVHATGLDLVTAGEVMSKPVFSVEVGTPLEAVALGMARRHVGSALVTDGGR